MLVAFPLTTARDRRWWSHWSALGSPDTPTSFFVRPLKKGAVDLPYTQGLKVRPFGLLPSLDRLTGSKVEGRPMRLNDLLWMELMAEERMRRMIISTVLTILLPMNPAIIINCKT